MLTVGKASADPFADGHAAWDRKDYVTAARAYSEAAAGGDPRAQGILGVMYEFGLGVDQNYAQAAQWLDLSAKQGNAGAQNTLGDLYSKGLGVTQNWSEAIRLYELAAAQGNADAQVNLGDIYRDGVGAGQDVAVALKWYQLAANQNNAIGQFDVGTAYLFGAGVSQNYAQAATSFSLSAQQSYAPAEAELGLMFTKGTGVPQDYSQGIHWFRLAVQQGNTMAAAFLGENYMTGTGVPQDYVRAYMWLNLAAPSISGDLQKTAMDERDQIAAKLSSHQLEVAQALGRQCQSSNFHDCGPDGATATATTEPGSVGPAGRKSSRRPSGTALQLAGTGSGFYVSSLGHVVTAAHVVNGCSEVRSQQIGTLRKVAVDDNLDLAVLLAGKKPASFARIQGSHGARLGEQIVVVGFPLHGVLSPGAIVTTGSISALAGLNDDRRRIQISAPVQPGNSGGPILGENGSVVGVVEGKLDAIGMANAIGDIPENVNFAVSLGSLQHFLNGHHVPIVLESRDIKQSSADIAAASSKDSVLLECWK